MSLKVERDAKTEPPIQTEYFLSGVGMMLISTLGPAKAVISFFILSAKPGKQVVPPERIVWQ